MKVKKRRRADKEDRRSQKRKIIGKRRQTKKKQKRRTKKRKKLCSTSAPGGNQVDGLPPVPHFYPACQYVFSAPLSVRQLQMLPSALRFVSVALGCASR